LGQLCDGIALGYSLNPVDGVVGPFGIDPLADRCLCDPTHLTADLALQKGASLGVGEHRPRERPGVDATDQDLLAGFEPLDLPDHLAVAERPGAAVHPPDLATLLQVAFALELLGAGPPLGLPIRVGDQVEDLVDRRVDECPAAATPHRAKTSGASGS